MLVLPIAIVWAMVRRRSTRCYGRMSRLLTTLLLYRSDYMVGKCISLESIIAKNKNSYYDALEQSQSGWHEGTDDPTPFIKYLLGIILAVYRDFEGRIDLVGEKASAVEIVRKAAYNKIAKMTKNDLLELCPSLAKSSVEAAIKQLVDAGELVKHGTGRTTFYIRNDAL